MYLYERINKLKDTDRVQITGIIVGREPVNALLYDGPAGDVDWHMQIMVLLTFGFMGSGGGDGVIYRFTVFEDFGMIKNALR